MVRGELQLVAVGRAQLRAGHDAGVRDEQVEARPRGEDAVGERPHRRQRREVDLLDDDGAGVRARERTPCLGDVADRGDHRCAPGRERAGRLGAETGRRTGHERDRAREVDAGEDLVGRRLAIESAGARHGRIIDA